MRSGEVLDDHIRVEDSGFADMRRRTKSTVAEVALLRHFCVATDLNCLRLWLFISHLVLRVKVGAGPINDRVFTGFAEAELALVVDRGSNDAVVLLICGFRLLCKWLFFRA